MTNADAHYPLTWNQVTAFRLQRHHLLERAPQEALVAVAGDMVGAQAQLLSAAQISLWSRVYDLRTADVEAALDERKLVKAACMRRTLFLAPAEELAVFVRGSARRAEKGIRWALGKGVPAHVLDAAIEATLDALDRPLTRAEIGERVSRALGVQACAVQGGGWGSRRHVDAVPVGDLTFPVGDLLHLAGARGVVCYGPDRDNQPTFVRADAWIPQWLDVPRDEAEELLLRRYLRAYGPATARDFALWSGMTLTEARAIWAREQGALTPVNVEGQTATLLQEDLDKAAQSTFEDAPVRLLPYFDTFLLGHQDREHLVAKEHQANVIRPQGWIAPVVLVDGRTAAVWKHNRKGSSLRVEVEPFRSLSPRITNGIREEAQDLGRFLGASDVSITIG